jgi:hypothetical protein
MAYDDAGLPGLRAARGFAACVASGASAVAEFQDVLERLQGQPMRRRDSSTVVESIHAVPHAPGRRAGRRRAAAGGLSPVPS